MLFRSSIDGGTNFQDSIILGNRGGDPNVAALENNVYLVWTSDDVGILYRKSNNLGNDFDRTVRIDNGVVPATMNCDLPHSETCTLGNTENPIIVVS